MSMRTCSTLCASGAGIAFASVGLVAAREDTSAADHSPRPSMTALASYPPHTSNFPQSGRAVSEGHQNGKVRSFKASIGEKRKLTPRATFGLGVEHVSEREEEGRAIVRAGTPNSQSHPQSWLRRLSSSMSSARSTPISRPSSSAALSQSGISHSNSMTFSQAGSTTPMFSGSSSPLPQPNKLVKRSSSFRDSNGSLQSSVSGSRLPVPVFRRPLTSHDRSLSLQQTPSRPESDRMSIDEDSDRLREPRLRQYFTPRVSGIPKPIKRLYPHRNYTPVHLVSGGASVRPARVELDFVFGDETGMSRPSLMAETGTASSPLPGQVPTFSEGDTPRSQPRWKRSGSKLLRRGRTRIVSAPTAMGNKVSSEQERPAKRRELDRSILSTASSNQHMDIDVPHHVEVHLGADEPERLSPHPIRPSATHSEITSTTIDSDSEYRSFGDDSTDQSDAVYDSTRTRTTTSSSKRHIGKIFDESPPNFSASTRSTKLKDLLNDGAFTGGDSGHHRHGTIEEEESSTGTPVRSVRENSVNSTPSVRPGAQQLLKSSPPAMSPMQDLDEIDWAAFDDDMDGGEQVDQNDLPAAGQQRIGQGLPFRFGSSLQPPPSTTSDNTPARQNGGNTDRTNLFDKWSESQPSPSVTHSPPRPRTMHANKKGSDSRGSRSTGRRAPSGIHARSHSVPVVPDVAGRRDNLVANKFGTWGVGSKGIIEDWNDEFDFDDLPEPVPDILELDERRVDSGHDMFVPQSIREQQQNVLTNIGLLREWGLLIEELKELRIRAVGLGMMDGPYAGDWLEVDGMIELADQETEERTLDPRRTPPSSPGFDYGAFEETVPSVRDRGHSERLSGAMMESERSAVDSARSVQTSTPQQTSAARARKDSEAVARSVIEALQSRRSVSDPTARSHALQQKKVPFDTATLRHIVPYVDRLKRTVKEGLRETEGLRTSPHRSRPRRSEAWSDEEEDEEDAEPAFRSIFNEPHSNEDVARRRSRRSQAVTDHDGSEGGDLANRMQGMNLPRQ